MSPFEQALADIRAIPTPAVEPTPEEPRSSAGCCTGDRRGYQWHQRTGSLPACADAVAANRAYMAPYLRARRAARMGGA